jgi:hypothetical protein
VWVDRLFCRGASPAPRRAIATSYRAERKRCRSTRGCLADLAVLAKDYDSVGAQEVAGTESLLTMVGGRIVYASGPFAALEDRPAN